MRPFFVVLTLCLGASLSALPNAQPSGLAPFGFGKKPLPLVAVDRYTLQAGDTATSVAKRYGITVETVLSYNRIQSPRYLRAGQTLEVPDRDGIVISLKTSSPITDLADQYGVFPELILLANQLPEDTKSVEGEVFVPGAKMDPTELRKLLGEYFAWPTVGGRISSRFGLREDPFTGRKSSHSGVDIATYHGAPVLAAGDGVVIYTGFNSVLGNHIKIDQGQGFVSLYGHLSAINTKVGKKVRAGQLIGRVGSTGYSTGPHLHFTAYRWGRLLNPMMLFG